MSSAILQKKRQFLQIGHSIEQLQQFIAHFAERVQMRRRENEIGREVTLSNTSSLALCSSLHALRTARKEMQSEVRRKMKGKESTWHCEASPSSRKTKDTSTNTEGNESKNGKREDEWRFLCFFSISKSVFPLQFSF